MQKRYLLAPGPTAIPPEVLLKMAEPILHHRNPLFEAVVAEVRENLKWLFGTKNEVLIFASSGTGAMEGAITNMLSPGDKAICVKSGKFGQYLQGLWCAVSEHRCPVGGYPGTC
jgi:aspartate aminotransferase-like enzyme